MENLGINLGFLLIQIINFAVIFIVLKVWVYGPLTKMLDKRRQIVAQGLEDARVTAEVRANAEREAQRLINEAQVKANDILREADVRAVAIKRDLVSAAEVEATQKVDQAMTEIDEERSRMLSELREEVVSLAMAAANKLVEVSLTEERQRALLREFFSGVRNGRIVALENGNLSGSTVDIASALPLTSDEMAIIKRDLVDKIGHSVKVTYRVDTSLLGGLVVQVGDRVVDGSVSGQIQKLRESLS